MNSSDSAGAAAFGLLGVALLFYIAIVGFMIFVYWKVATKAGYPGWYSLGFLVHSSISLSSSCLPLPSGRSSRSLMHFGPGHRSLDPTLDIREVPVPSPPRRT